MLLFVLAAQIIKAAVGEIIVNSKFRCYYPNVQLLCEDQTFAELSYFGRGTEYHEKSWPSFSANSWA